MRYIRSVSKFVLYNHVEIQKMVHSICIRYNVTAVEDVLQDFYELLISHKILTKYDPHHPAATKISTYLYRTIENLVFLRIKSNETKIERHCIDQDFYEFFHQHEDDENTDIPPEQIKVEYENMIYRNGQTDTIDGLSFDLRLFEDHLRKKNKHFALNKRKDKLVGEYGLDFLKVFKLLQAGYSNHEIACKYGISDMFISTLKSEIKEIMIKFGIVWNYRAVRGRKLQEV